MYERVEVVKKNSNNTIDVCCPTKACENCSGTAFCNVKGKTFEAYVKKEHADIKVGDQAELYLPPSRTISSTFITLMIPLLCFPLFYFIFPLENENLRFIISLLGIVVGFFFVNIYFKKTMGKYYPTVFKVYENTEESAKENSKEDSCCKE